MEKNIKIKVIASALIFILTLASMQGIIIEGINVYASSIENQNQETNHKNVNFNAQFMVINNEKKHSIRENISNSEIYLNIFAEIKEEGYLKSGTISMQDENGDSANFKLDKVEEPATIQNIDYNKNEIVLNQINNGEQMEVNIPIEAITNEVFDLNNFSKDTVATFKGIYVDGKGQEKEIKKEIKLRAEWKEEVEGILTQETSRVLPFEVESKKGYVISENIKVGILEGKLPIKTLKANITVPTINNVVPIEVRVEKINSNIDLNSDYKDGKLNLTLNNNVSENGTIIWSKIPEEYEITYIFENIENSTEEIDKIANYQGTDAKSSIVAEIEAYSSENKIISIESSNIINILNKVGEKVEANNKNITQSIEKGYMLNTNLETEFTVESNIDIAYEKLVEKVVVNELKDEFVLNELPLEANTYYKKIIVSKENLNRILGEIGEIKIYSEDVLLGTITNNIEADESGNIIFDFENNTVNNIKIETSKPVYSGMLKLEYVKAIKDASVYKKEDIKNITALKLQKNINESIIVTNIEMKNPTTKINLETNTNILSTVVENNDIEFTVTLNNNNSSCDLFENPQIEIVLPACVADIEINNVKLLLEDELVIKNYEYIKETNSIIVNLEGIGTKYSLNEFSYGITIVVNTNITVDKLAGNKKDKVKLFVVNEAVTSYESVLEEKGYGEKGINIVAPLGLIAINSAEDFNEQDDEAVSISDNEAVGKLEANSKMQTATMKITSINNYETPINNIRILGRIPFKGNKSLTDGTDLGTTFNAILKQGITSEIVPLDNIIIYYSENGEATEDLENSENCWKEQIEDLSKVKSYLITLKNYEMTSGEKIEFKYEIEIPEGLELGNSAHGTYIVYYDNKENNVVFENKSIATVVGLTTGEAPKLDVTLNSNIDENEVVRSGQIIKYTVNVKNTGAVNANQVFLTANIPEGVTYTELVLGGNYEDDYYELYSEKTAFNELIGDLKVGEEKKIEYLVRVNENIEEQKEIKTKARISAKNLPEMIESLEVKSIIDNGSMLIELKQSIKESEKVKVGENITYTTTISNISDYDINNVISKVELPQGLTYKNAYIKDSNTKADYNANTKLIKWNIGQLEKEGYAEIVLEAVTNNEAENLNMCVKATGENISEHKSNILKLNICKPNIVVKQESSIPEGYVAIGDKLEYKIQVKNTGTLDATNLQIIDYLPEGIKYLETSYEIMGTQKTIKSSSESEAKLALNVPANEMVNMNVKVKVDETDSEKQATNIVKVLSEGSEVEANKLTHIIEAKTLGSDANVELTNTYKISGTAWLDKNANGQKDNDESVLAGITVMLLDKKTGQIAKDANGQELNTTTEGTGNYTFRNLNAGEYMAMFTYDTSKYILAEYKKSDVDESKNSDVVDMKISINGEEKSVAVSDTIKILNENIYNINIGLKEMPKFDLKLDKYVSKITAKSSSDTKTYDYQNTKMAKVELNSKTANGTTLIIEYKIKITNEGSMAGYAKKIIDYIPKELKFSSELNNSWYLADDGNVYSSELANTKLNSGESKELTLILTKQINGENTGLVNNNAEIGESYNDYGVQDIDSMMGNKKTGEDDVSNADIFIGIKTGSPVTYIGLSILIMVVLGAGAYLINTKILNKDLE